jgi:hypothetical protein
MKRSLRSRRIRAVLIPLNFIVVAAMLIGLTFGTPPTNVIAIVMMVTVAASIIAVLIER